jgi:hypothetical protein
MKQYIFVTPEGNTETPNGKDIENLQVIGFAQGENEIEAIKNLPKRKCMDLGFRF